MNREEKNLQTRQKIMNSALVEFSEKSYGEASLNTICAAGKIAKGTIYHYFKDKEELYLLCVKECFDALTAYLEEAVLLDHLSMEAALERYFDARIAFFEKYPLYLGIFCSARINPPAHLSAAIDEITADINAQAVSILTTLLKMVKLRADVTMEEVIAIFRAYQDFVHTQLQRKTTGEIALQEHEKRCRRSLQILLYGVIERGKTI